MSDPVVALFDLHPHLDKLEWHHVIHVAHFFGLALLLSQPITAGLIWLTRPYGDLPVARKFAELNVRMDRVAQVGIGILILSGIGQIWAHGIGPGDIFSHQVWLAIKLVLVAVLVVFGYFFAGRAIKDRRVLLQQLDGTGTLTADQQAALDQTLLRTQITGGVMAVLILLILFMVMFRPFTVHPL